MHAIKIKSSLSHQDLSLSHYRQDPQDQQPLQDLRHHPHLQLQIAARISLLKSPIRSKDCSSRHHLLPSSAFSAARSTYSTVQ